MIRVHGCHTTGRIEWSITRRAVIPLLALVSLLLLSAKSWATLRPEQLAQLPAASPGPVNFREQIKPIFEASCIKCHGHGRSRGGFRIDSRQTLLAGGDSGAAAVPGKSAQSLLIELVSGLDPDNVMPQKGSRLKAEQVALLRAWIDQGLPWDEGIGFGRVPPVNLFPRHVDVPAALPNHASPNPVDRFVEHYFQSRHITPTPVVDDRVFARRAYLDVVGLLPPARELEAFVADRRADKRERLVTALLADNVGYAENWLTFWNDLLRNDYQGTGYIDGGREQITQWLFQALAKNMPYDRFVAELVNPRAGCAGFTKGIVWRGVVNASQTPQMQAAQNISQVFMGINLKCASCHDSFINDWTLADSYGLAGVYADGPLEMVRCDKPTGERAALKFLFPELGNIAGTMDRSQRIERLASIITERQNGRLTRTIVNRLWARFLGRGLVEPVDEMNNAARDQDLLDWLAEDLADHGYDLKRTMVLILTSQAYQLPAVNQDEKKAGEFAFHGPFVRRMTAEQFLDAVSSLTDTWNSLPANREIDLTAGRAAPAPDSEPDLANTAIPAARWIGGAQSDTTNSPAEALYLRKQFRLPTTDLDQAILVCTADHEFKLYLNGKELAGGNDWKRPHVVDLLGHLLPGNNTLAVVVSRSLRPGRSGRGPVFLVSARLRALPGTAGSTERSTFDFASDNTWRCSEEKSSGWEASGFNDERWLAATELGGPAAEPWNIEKALQRAVAMAAQQNRTRAALVNNNALMTALGRPNREQVVTVRPSEATTLQALELTNGAILAHWLNTGATRLLRNWTGTADAFINGLFYQAYGRVPDKEELALATELTGEPLRHDGVEDFLWTMTMSPEFQLIY